MRPATNQPNNCRLHAIVSRKSTAMPPKSRRRRLADLPKAETGGAAVENALILSLTAVMIYSFKLGTGVANLVKPAQQAFATLIKELS